jgi:hypothetical protein
MGCDVGSVDIGRRSANGRSADRGRRNDSPELRDETFNLLWIVDRCPTNIETAEELEPTWRVSRQPESIQGRPRDQPDCRGRQRKTKSRAGS